MSENNNNNFTNSVTNSNGNIEIINDDIIFEGLTNDYIIASNENIILTNNLIT